MQTVGDKFGYPAQPKRAAHNLNQQKNAVKDYQYK